VSSYTRAARSSLQIRKCEKLLECLCSGQTPRQLPKDSQALACDTLIQSEHLSSANTISYILDSSPIWPENGVNSSVETRLSSSESDITRERISCFDMAPKALVLRVSLGVSQKLRKIM
jgi:hypothetical protein